MSAPPKDKRRRLRRSGSSFAGGFIWAGVPDIVAYDDPPAPMESELAVRRAAELGVPLSFAPGPLADRDIVFSNVTQDAAMSAAPNR